MLSTNSPVRKVMEGAAAGLIATAPMTVFMRSAWRQLPVHEKQVLPPRQITRTVLQKAGLRWRFSGREKTILTRLLHFGFGAMAGSLYGLLENNIPLRSPVKGSLAGLAVWTGSYLGWIPALGILPPATRHAWRRNLLMILAHLVWGLALGMLTQIFNSRKRYINLE